MDEIEVGQVWKNKFHERESTVMHIDIHDGEIRITYRAEKPGYKEEPDTRKLDEKMFRWLYVRGTTPTEHG